MPEILIGKPMARLVLASAWYQQHKDDPGFPKHFELAATRKWQVKMGVYSTKDAQGLLTTAQGVLDELLATGAKTATIQPVLDFKNKLSRDMQQLAVVEEREEQEAKVKAAKEAVENRRWRTESRERTMDPIIESGRWQTAQEICEDYGLELNMQTRAALLAAMHHGAQQLSQASTSLLFHTQRQTINPDKIAKLIEGDKHLFTVARGLAAEQKPQGEESGDATRIA